MTDEQIIRRAKLVIFKIKPPGDGIKYIIPVMDGAVPCMVTFKQILTEDGWDWQFESLAG